MIWNKQTNDIILRKSCIQYQYWIKPFFWNNNTRAGKAASCVHHVCNQTAPQRIFYKNWKVVFWLLVSIIINSRKFYFRASIISLSRCLRRGEGRRESVRGARHCCERCALILLLAAPSSFTCRRCKWSELPGTYCELFKKSWISRRGSFISLLACHTLRHLKLFFATVIYARISRHRDFAVAAQSVRANDIRPDDHCNSFTV